MYHQTVDSPSVLLKTTKLSRSVTFWVWKSRCKIHLPTTLYLCHFSLACTFNMVSNFRRHPFDHILTVIQWVDLYHPRFNLTLQGSAIETKSPPSILPQSTFSSIHRVLVLCSLTIVALFSQHSQVSIPPSRLSTEKWRVSLPSSVQCIQTTSRMEKRCLFLEGFLGRFPVCTNTIFSPLATITIIFNEQNDSPGVDRPVGP